MAGIYIHIPFCKQACHYCDFHFSTTLQWKVPLLQAIKTELALQHKYLFGKSISTIYFGGGTPSLLTPDEIQGIFEEISLHYKLNKVVETTLEANPDDLDPDRLAGLKDSGINRLSIGIQSFQDPVLNWMNRAHNSEQAFDCIQAARSAGFDNISIDLIYGVPLKEHDFGNDLSKAVDMHPDHISAYNLTIEPGTVFGHRHKQGKLKEVSEHRAAEEFMLAMARLVEHGYQHYEISNFALPEMESLHNYGYWDGSHYLGIGPSAHSFNGNSRQFNVANNNQYLQAIEKGKLPFTFESLSISQRINERIMLGLRTSRGIDLQLLAKDFQWDLYQEYRPYIEELGSNGYLRMLNNNLLLTDKGKLIADRIAGDLFVVE